MNAESMFVLAVRRANVMKLWPVCALCGERKSTDMHEIIPRSQGAWVQDTLPVCLRVGLCNACNKNEADKSANRVLLVKKLIAVFGREVIAFRAHEIHQLHPALSPAIWQDIETALNETAVSS